MGGVLFLNMKLNDSLRAGLKDRSRQRSYTTNIHAARAHFCGKLPSAGLLPDDGKAKFKELK
jgi:hypothetical protein